MDRFSNFYDQLDYSGSRAMVALAPSHLLGSAESRSQVPCWPNQPRLVVVLTRDLDRFTGDLLFQLPLVFVAIFAFSKSLGYVLHFIGYDDLVLLKAQYAYVSKTIGGISFIDFQLLEIVAWASIGIWGGRLLLGIVFLKQYDRYFLAVSETNSGKVYGAFILFAVSLYATISMQRHLAVPLFVFLMRNLPQVYFSLISIMWFSSAWGVTSASLFIIWKLFRQKRPGAVLWSKNLSEGG
jgi:hypothetical protein